MQSILSFNYEILVRKYYIFKKIKQVYIIHIYYYTCIAARGQLFDVWQFIKEMTTWIIKYEGINNK